MTNHEQPISEKIVLERALLISPTSFTSDIPEGEASQGVTIESLRELDKEKTKKRLRKALGYLSVGKLL